MLFMIESFGARVLLSCLLQLVLHILFYGQPFLFRALEILYAVVIAANTANLVRLAYQSFQRLRPILGGLAALAAFPALALGVFLLGMLLSRP